jgi:hypothetical protein
MNAVLAGANSATCVEDVARVLHDLGSSGSGVGVNIVAIAKAAERFRGS